jgi:hypothetical protein
MVVIGIALVTGHYGELERWSRQQAIAALEWREPLPYFFSTHQPIKYGRKPMKITKIDK